MNRAFAQSLTNPTATLGIPVPVGRKLHGWASHFWMMFFVLGSFASVSIYIYQVSRAAEDGFLLRRLEQQRDEVRETVADLENKLDQVQAVAALEKRVQGMGYVPVQRAEYMDGASGSLVLNR